MYANKRVRIRSHEMYKDEVRQKVTVVNLKSGLIDSKIESHKISSVIIESMYWRKDNQIHAWFVKNIQAGEDDCGEYYISKEKLTELLNTINKVLADHSLASTLLPSEDGFFFGSTDYDEYYYNALERTKEWIESIDLEDYNEEYYYSSSW